MPYHQNGVKAEEALYLTKCIKRRLSDNKHLFSYVSVIGSASSVNSNNRGMIGSDYDLVVVPSNNVPMGEFILRLYEIIRQVSNDIKERFETKYCLPFSESHVQNSALSSSQSYLEEKSGDLDPIPLHVIIIGSLKHLQESFPPNFSIKGEEILGNINNVPKIRDEGSKISSFIEGIHKHSSGLMNPKAYPNEIVIGDALHAINQAEKDLGRTIIEGESKEQKLSADTAIEKWENCIREMDKLIRHTENTSTGDEKS